MQSLRPHVTYVALLALFYCAFIWGLEAGILGHDYFYFFPKLLDGKWHFLRQGLAPFYYTPHMCGGFPEYANPQSMYYSLQQLLVLFMDLWLAMKVTILTSMTIAYVGWYRFGKDLLKLNLHFAHILALIISAHGFHFMHMIPGHIVFHGMPLLGWFLWLLFDRRNHDARGLMYKAAWFGLGSAYVFYSGGYMVAVMGIFAVLTFLPYELILHAKTLSSRIKILIKNTAACLVGALLLNASKLVAVFSFVQYFPRAVPFERLWNDVSIYVYIFRALFALPQVDELFWDFGMGKWGAFHEYSFLISPVVVIGLLLGVYLLWKEKHVVHTRWMQTGLYVVTTLCLLIFCAQWMQGYGPLVTPFETLPIFEGLHVNMRWLYAFSFLPIAASVWCLQKLFPTRGALLGIISGVITISAFTFGYYEQLHRNTLPRTLPYDEITVALDEQEGYLDLEADEAFDMRGLGHSGFVPLIFGGSHIYCHEPMLLGSSSLPDTVIAAPVREIRDGSYNLYNPSCMVYPDVNNCAVGDRIAATDTANLEAFINGHNTTWKVSPLQRFANWVNVLSLLLCIVIGIKGMRH